jgi:hypothetical protein
MKYVPAETIKMKKKYINKLLKTLGRFVVNGILISYLGLNFIKN